MFSSATKDTGESVVARNWYNQENDQRGTAHIVVFECTPNINQ
jgi:hypothetical protein